MTTGPKVDPFVKETSETEVGRMTGVWPQTDDVRNLLMEAENAPLRCVSFRPGTTTCLDLLKGLKVVEVKKPF